MVFRKNFLNFINLEIRRLIKYSLGGLGNTFISALMAFLIRLSTTLPDYTVYSISTIFGLTFSILFNLNYTFKAGINFINIFKFLLCFIFSLLSASSLSRFIEQNDIPFALNQLFSMCFYSSIMYALLRKVFLKTNKNL